MVKDKKTKKVKVMTVPVEKPEAPTGIGDVVAALNALTISRGWQIITRVLDENIKYLEQAILEKQDPLTKITLTDEEVEGLRYKRGLNIEVKNTPNKYIKVVEDTGVIPEDFDPFYKTAKEMRKAEGLPEREEPK